MMYKAAIALVLLACGLILAAALGNGAGRGDTASAGARAPVRVAERAGPQKKAARAVTRAQNHGAESLPVLDGMAQFTPGTVQATGMDEQTARDAQRLVDSVWTHMGEALAGTLQAGAVAGEEELETINETAVERQVKVVRIAEFALGPCPEKGGSLREELKTGLADLAGEAAAERIMQGMDPLALCGWGQEEVRGKVHVVVRPQTIRYVEGGFPEIAWSARRELEVWFSTSGGEERLAAATVNLYFANVLDAVARDPR